MAALELPCLQWIANLKNPILDGPGYPATLDVGTIFIYNAYEENDKACM